MALATPAKVIWRHWTLWKLVARQAKTAAIAKEPSARSSQDVLESELAAAVARSWTKLSAEGGSYKMDMNGEPVNPTR